MLTRPTLHLAAAAICSLIPVPAQSTLTMHPSRAFKFEPPDGWRQLTVVEARQLSRTKADEFPADVIDYRNMQPIWMPYGNVVRWLSSGFDGECLIVYLQDNEVSIDDEGMAAIRDNAHRVVREGRGQRDILSLEPTELGDRHEAIEAIARMRVGSAAPLYRTLEYYVPTAGSTLMLAFRCRDADFAAAEPRFRKAAQTVVLARPSRGKDELSDWLVQAVLIGALVGMGLAILQKSRRKSAESQ